MRMKFSVHTTISGDPSLKTVWTGTSLELRRTDVLYLSLKWGNRPTVCSGLARDLDELKTQDFGLCQCGSLPGDCGMTIYGDFIKFAGFRPNYKNIRVPGNLPSFPKSYESCGAQLSVAFHGSGDPLNGRGYPCQETFKSTPRYIDYDGITCIISVPEFYWYLKGKYEDPDNYVGSESALRA